jgi:hypothetical protein
VVVAVVVVGLLTATTRQVQQAVQVHQGQERVAMEHQPLLQVAVVVVAVKVV